MIRLLLFLFALTMAAPAAGEAPEVIRQGEVRLCASGQAFDACRPTPLPSVPVAGGEALIARKVFVDPSAFPLKSPLTVWLIATASSEVRWNGRVIGRNGVPGRDSASEVPGRFIATVTVPAEAVRPGENIVSARLSAHHLWLPVRRTVQEFEVGPYAPAILPGLTSYLPALLALGALAAAAFFFAFAVFLDRHDRSALLLALTAAAAILQLAVETARSFILYSYPWHLARVGAIALLAAVTGVIVTAYAARRFAPQRKRAAVGGAAVLAVGALILIPWYDIKALGALVAAALIVLACTLSALRRRVTGSAVGTAASILFLLLLAWQRTRFLDEGYYLFVAALLAVLVAEHLVLLRHSRRAQVAGEAKAEDLAETVRRLAAQGGGGSVAQLRDGSRTIRIAREDIIAARAADDYSELSFADGRRQLVTMSLSALEEALAPGFARVHKSHIVNLARVRSVTPRPGGGRLLSMSDGSTVPVGRAYLAEVAPIERR